MMLLFMLHITIHSNKSFKKQYQTGRMKILHIKTYWFVIISCNKFYKRSVVFVSLEIYKKTITTL